MFDILAVSAEIKDIVGNLHPDWRMTSSHDDFGDQARHSIFINYFRPSDNDPTLVQAALSLHVTPKRIRVAGGASAVIPHTAADWKVDLLTALGAQPALAGPT
jgi:hypothetical protein